MRFCGRGRLWMLDKHCLRDILLIPPRHAWCLALRAALDMEAEVSWLSCARLTPKQTAPHWRGCLFTHDDVSDQSPSVSSEALPPAAVVLTVIVFSVVKRGR